MKSPAHKSYALASLMAAVALLTSGCGGGGGDAGTPAPPTAPAVEPPAVTSVPAAVFDDPRRKSAFDRLNEFRALAGVGLLRQNKLADQAAQAHSAYQIFNNTVTHDETNGAQGFTGQTPFARLHAVGLIPLTDFTTDSEVAATWDYSAGVSNYTGGVPNEAGANLIDSLIGTPFHRIRMLRPDFAEAGFGVYNNGKSATITVDLMRNDKNIQGAPNTIAIIWPPDGQTNVPTVMHSEEPDPIPENNGSPAGYPASLQINILFRSVDANTFRIIDPSGNEVPTKLLTYKLNTSNGDHSFTAAVPKSPLKKGTRYSVIFDGVISDDKDGIIPLKKNWSFTTGQKEIF